MRARARVEPYERKSEWCGWSVHEGPLGWVVEFWSRVPGRRSGERLLLSYSGRLVLSRGQDLYAVLHPDTGETAGDIIAELAARRGPDVQVLRRGWVIR